ncbi:MAG: limonene-1,2-epoxide hydrolase [Candidatus Azotimanducaceae bacterium]|jgi:limonene-1,2-epoxide hydrolase
MDIEARIGRLESIEAIRQLKARYCQVCDDNQSTDEIVKLFTDDVIWEDMGIGRTQGPEGLIALFKSFEGRSD